MGSEHHGAYDAAMSARARASLLTVLLAVGAATYAAVVAHATPTKKHKSLEYGETYIPTGPGAYSGRSAKFKLHNAKHSVTVTSSSTGGWSVMLADGIYSITVLKPKGLVYTYPASITAPDDVVGRTLTFCSELPCP